LRQAHEDAWSLQDKVLSTSVHLEVDSL